MPQRQTDPATDALLQRMLEKELGRDRRSFFARLTGRQEGTSQAARTGGRRGDLMIAALGIALGLICALFPWYIFFNQEKFGIRPMKFSGNSSVISERMVLTDQPERVGAPMQIEEPPAMELDLFATGTLPDMAREDGFAPPGVDQQPFPAEEPAFKLVHVANGRAMIEDDTGLWVVQRGSKLPDSSTVAAIELRNGEWVLVTSEERIIGMK